ncbi:MAG: riboflavin biosynthesis protein RibF [Planctomycetota bacterium]|nr:riboflavin biosynthesis protein RibF [Planctomycetota bacterium]
MRIIEGLQALSPSYFKNPSVTIGVFDGFHLGHRRVIESLVEEARLLRGESIVLTFKSHPKSVLRGSPPAQIMSLPHRLLYFERAGISSCIVMEFDRTLAVMSAQEFVEDVLIKRIGVKSLVLGFDSSFGRNGEGTADFVARVYPQVAVVRCAKVEVDGVVPSSSLIRRPIIGGRLDEAKRLLGHSVSLYGEVVKGRGRGRALGFPTANIIPDNEALPPSGVYASRVLLGSGESFGSIANVGVRPTFSENTPLVVEVHIFDFSRCIYGEKIEVEILKFIREECRFKSSEELISQIHSDIRAAKRILVKE